MNRLMEPYLDRQLNALSIEQIKAHLTSCEACRRRWGGLIELLANPAPVAVPEGLAERILVAWETRQAERADSPRRVAASAAWARRFRLVHYAGAIAACVLFFVTGWLFSGWWRQPAAGVTEGTGTAPTITVMVSPWVLSSMAQAAAMPAPVNPAVMLASGVVPEMMVPAPAESRPVRYFERPSGVSTTQPAETDPARNLQLLPMLPPRYLGA
ncbi:MAG TPA: zf-HC2 domain-containing protein [Phycisphaerae bacterium]|nr:zf-HC2 domain-containing protein [Phycisphaerae bacterium]HPU27947.1 zf-HC2 domain-containing protein [Phycisphaerae bacterium]